MRDGVFFLTCVGQQTMRKAKRSAQERSHLFTAQGQTLAMDRVAQLVTKQRSSSHTKMLLCPRAPDFLRLALRVAKPQN